MTFYDAFPSRTRTGVNPTTFLTPYEADVLGEWCPLHVYEPTDPPMPFHIAHELTDPIFETSRLKKSDKPDGPVTFNTEIQDSLPDPQSIANGIGVEMSLPLDVLGAYSTLCHIIASAEVTLAAPGRILHHFLLLSTVRVVLMLPLAVLKAWFAAFLKGISGLVFGKKGLC